MLKDLVTVASSDDTNVVLTHVYSGDRQGTNKIVHGSTTINETSNATNGVANASGLISMVDDALRVVATERASLGATQAWVAPKEARSVATTRRASSTIEIKPLAFATPLVALLVSFIVVDP